MPLLNTLSDYILRATSIILWMFTSFAMTAQIGIGLPAGEDPESTLDVRYDSAVSPGFLMPRVTALPTGDIAQGMLVFYCPNCTDSDGDGNINYEEGTYYVYTDHDGDGDLEWTTLAESSGITLPDTQAPTVPTNLIASGPTMSSIDLTWTASTDNIGVTGYYIYFSGGSLAATVTSGTSTTITGLSSNTSYTFYATAYDAAGNESNSSNEATLSTLADTEAPTIPQNLVATAASSSAIDLSWSASTDNVGVVGYYVYYSSDDSLAATVAGTSTTISGLEASTNYEFYVTAYDAAGNESAASDPADATTNTSCFSVGDYDSVNKGIVFWVSSQDCSNYKIVSLVNLNFNGDYTRDWARRDDDLGDNAESSSNGYGNTERYVDYYANENGEHDTAPWLAWHFDPDGGSSHIGWYLGATDEWTELYSVLSTVNSALDIQTGATQLITSSGSSNEYWTSTERGGGGDNNKEDARAIGLDNGATSWRDKDDNKYVRAFREIGG